MADSSARSKAASSPSRRERLQVRLWHGAWAAAVLAGLGGLWLAFGQPDERLLAALAAAAAPGVAGLALPGDEMSRWRALLLALWGVAGAAAAVLAGGISGPLAIWCLAPIAAAAVMGTPRLLAFASALALAAAAAASLVEASGYTPAAPAASLTFWLALLAMATAGVGLGAGLLISRRRAQRELSARRSEAQRFQRFLAEQPHLMLVLDAEGVVQAAFGSSPLGIPEEILAGVRLEKLSDPSDADAVNAAVAAAFAQGAAVCRFAPRGAPDRTCDLDLRRGSEGVVLAAVRDATSERAREAELEAAREAAEALNAGKSRFLANMSHELRTPLNAIMGFSDVMKSRLFGDLLPRYAEYAELIHDAGRHLLDLINDVLDISKIEAERYELHRELIDAREPVSGALRLTRLQADAAGVSLRGLLPPRPLEVDADPRALKQIVLNLVSNALKFTPRGGSVTVAVSAVGEDLEIIVSDTGVGIAEADLDRLGRPYEQAGDSEKRNLGTGLGLSLVRAFAELHGGGMSIESRLGEGASITVRMPVLLPVSGDLDPGPPLPSAKIIAFNPGAGRAANEPGR